MKTVWAERNSVERGLIVALAVVVVCLGLVFWAWTVQLRPWAPVWGTWADWVAAGGTVLGFAAAVITLNKNTRDQNNQRQEDIRAEASRAAITVPERGTRNFDNPGTGSVNFGYSGRVHNAASSPIRGVKVELDETKLSDKYELNFYHVRWDLGTISAGETAGFLIQVDVSASSTAPPRAALTQAMNLLFTDVHGYSWCQSGMKVERSGTSEGHPTGRR